MKTLVYVHGTNGSGKSTLARAVLAAAGGATAYHPMGGCICNSEGVEVRWGCPVHTGEQKRVKAGYTTTPRGVSLLGKYDRACGGVDGFSPYAAIHDVLIRHAIFPKVRVFAEGLVTPGVETCQKMADYFDGSATFIHLDTPHEVCLTNVLARRARAARIKGKEMTPYTGHANLLKKAQSAAHWADRLEKAGLTVMRLQYQEARDTVLELLGLPSPGVDDLL